jgi:hypothetical protein
VPTRSPNEQRLRDAGVIKSKVRRLPEEYRAVVEGLTPDEVDVIVAVHRRLKEAERVTQKFRPGTGGDDMVAIMMPP